MFFKSICRFNVLSVKGLSARTCVSFYCSANLSISFCSLSDICSFLISFSVNVSCYFYNFSYRVKQMYIQRFGKANFLNTSFFKSFLFNFYY